MSEEEISPSQQHILDVEKKVPNLSKQAVDGHLGRKSKKRINPSNRLRVIYKILERSLANQQYSNRGCTELQFEKHATHTMPELEAEGVLRIEMADHLTMPEFIEIMSEFNDAYTSIRFLLRRFSSNYSQLRDLLTFPPVNALPTIAQPTLARAQFNSPGFWEVLGNLNPLKVLCDYLQQRHERKKDINYRNRAEEQRLILENLMLSTEVIKQNIKNMKEVGFSNEEMIEILSNYIADPLEKLGKRMDIGQITALDTKSIKG